jgi:hypothetical protein
VAAGVGCDGGLRPLDAEGSGGGVTLRLGGIPCLGRSPRTEALWGAVETDIMSDPPLSLARWKKVGKKVRGKKASGGKRCQREKGVKGEKGVGERGVRYLFSSPSFLCGGAALFHPAGGGQTSGAVARLRLSRQHCRGGASLRSPARVCEHPQRSHDDVCALYAQTAMPSPERGS